MINWFVRILLIGALGLVPVFAQVTKLPISTTQPGDITTDGRCFYVPVDARGRIDVLDFLTGAVLRSMTVPDSNPGGIALDGAGRMFVTGLGGRVFEMDVETGAIYNIFSLPFRSGGIAFDGFNLFISDWDSTHYWVTDRYGNFLRELDMPCRTNGICYDKDTGNFWIMNGYINEVTPQGEMVRRCRAAYCDGEQVLGGITLWDDVFYLAAWENYDYASAAIFVFEKYGLDCDPDISITIEDAIVFFENGVLNQTIAGVGPGNSAQGRLKAFRNMLLSISDLIHSGLIEEACDQLEAAIKKCDGVANPPDFITGSDVPDLLKLLKEVKSPLGCPTR